MVSSSTFPLLCLQVFAAPRATSLLYLYLLYYSVLDPAQGKWNDAHQALEQLLINFFLPGSRPAINNLAPLLDLWGEIAANK